MYFTLYSICFCFVFLQHLETIREQRIPNVFRSATFRASDDDDDDDDVHDDNDNDGDGDDNYGDDDDDDDDDDDRWRN